MLEEFKKHIEDLFPDLTERPFLLACSAGVDSTVLAHLCHRSGLRFSLGHCNFQLRGSESDGDEEFVRDLAQKLHKNVFVSHFETNSYATLHKVSIQMAARELRYDWFAKILRENGLHTLVTAHHADDDLETFLINLSRGTGIDGLTGIPSKTQTLSRPLLKFSRDQILEYARSENIAWREESTNAETKYLRNKIRHHIVPLLKGLHPTFLENFKKTQAHLGQTAVLSENHVQQIKEEVFETVGAVTRISIDTLTRLSPISPYLYHLFRPFGFSEWNDIEHLLTAQSGKQVLSATHRLVKDREYLLLARIPYDTNAVYTINENDSGLDFPIRLSIGRVEEFMESGENVLYVDKETLKYPLTVRKWEIGDYFYPLGMDGKKKLSKFFKDEKMDIISKKEQWLLCSKNQIVWVIGKRADDRFKVKGQTRHMLQIKWLP